MRTAWLAAFMAVMAFPSWAYVVQPGQIMPVRFFCTTAEPLLEMLALDAQGQPEAAGERFDQARKDGACFVLQSVVPGRAKTFLAESVTVSSGPVELWEVELPGVPGPVYAGFRSDMAKGQAS